MNPKRENRYARRCRSMLIALAAGVLGLSMVHAAQDLDGLQIVVLEGEDNVNIIAQGTAVPTLVEVRDRNNLPVAGASVVFLLEGAGTTATLNAGLSQVALTTNALGQAAVTVNPLASGAVNLTVNAAFQGQTATATIVHTNFATAAQAAAGAGTTGGTGGGAGGGLGTGAIIGIVGAGVGAAVAAVAVATTQAKPCTFSVLFSQQDFNAVGGDGAMFHVEVRAEPVDCSPSEWTAESDSAFISVNPGRSSGTGSVTVTVGQNGPNDRSGTVTIAGRTIDIFQVAAVTPCNQAVVPGGNTAETHRIGLGRTSGRFVFNYNTQSVKDRMIVRYEGRVLFDTGCVGTGGVVSRTLSFSGRSSVVEVEVVPNCAGGSGTSVVIPGSLCNTVSWSWRTVRIKLATPGYGVELTEGATGMGSARSLSPRAPTIFLGLSRVAHSVVRGDRPTTLYTSGSRSYPNVRRTGGHL